MATRDDNQMVIRDNFIAIKSLKQWYDLYLHEHYIYKLYKFIPNDVNAPFEA